MRRPFDAHPDPKRGWVGHWPAPVGLARALSAVADAARPWAIHRSGLALALALGGVTAALSPGVPGARPILAGLLATLLLGTVPGDRPRRGLLLLGLAFAAHGACVIGLSWHAPETVAALPGTEDYLARQARWLSTGTDPESTVLHWLPAQTWLATSMVGYGYLSMGFIPLVEGFTQVEVTHVYVGRLAAVSTSPMVALLLGWAPWSLLRGLCLALLSWEVTSWSFARMTCRSVSTPERRLFRWLGVGALFGADCLTKLLWLETVRGALADNLLGPL